MLFLLLLVVFFLLFGCSKKAAESVPHYDGWLTYSCEHFVFHYPADCFWGKRMETFSDAYERYLAEDCDFLGIEIPGDTIHFYIHNNPEEGKKLTGHDLPFHTENQVHWGRRSAFGLELARFLIDKMEIRRTDYDFLYDGLAALRDYSGNDYHHNTAALLELKKYIPLDSLIANESYARADEHHRVWEAASLTAFISYNFGINRFKMLWQSTATFEETIRELFQTDVKTFENTWLEFAKISYEGIEKRVLYQDTTKGK